MWVNECRLGCDFTTYFAFKSIMFLSQFGFGVAVAYTGGTIFYHFFYGTDHGKFLGGARRGGRAVHHWITLVLACFVCEALDEAHEDRSSGHEANHE